MVWLALVLTLILEQLRALPAQHPLSGTVEAIADGAERHLNAGRRRHGMYAWLLVVGGAAAAVGVVYWIAASISWIVALAVNVGVLYLTLGFRQFSHHFTEIQVALDNGDLATARRELTAWKRPHEAGYDAADLDAAEIVRQSIEFGLLLSHRHVFGVLVWFVLLPGPIGPVVYRLADYLARRWNRPPAGAQTPDRFGDFARRVFAWIDWLPARLTALAFAIVGDFEGAIYCWRQVARVPSAEGVPGPDSRALILGAASGAIGTRIMSAAETARYFDEAGQEGAALAEPEPRTLRSVVGLVWRALVLWLVVLLLLTLAAWAF
ncbi:MAG: CobD/CbiB family protein [Burkholderiaceae bacterium]|nr:CobD/CbiB family protein [Burkholderiaceae bacterium]